MLKTMCILVISAFIGALIAGVAVLVTGRSMDNDTVTIVGLIIVLSGACGSLGTCMGLILGSMDN